MTELRYRQMQENIRIMHAAVARCQMLNRDEELRERLAAMSTQVGILESVINGKLQVLSDQGPEDPPLIWALRTALRDNPNLTDLDIASLVRQTLKEGWKS